jgi:hypothetical protein
MVQVDSGNWKSSTGKTILAFKGLFLVGYNVYVT